MASKKGVVPAGLAKYQAANKKAAGKTSLVKPMAKPMMKKGKKA